MLFHSERYVASYKGHRPDTIVKKTNKILKGHRPDTIF